MKKKDYTLPIVVIVGLFLLTMILIVAVSPVQRLQVQPVMKQMPKVVGTAPVAYGGRMHVEVIDQNVTTKVAVLSIALKENGYVVIHKEEKGKPGKIVGVSKMLAPGLTSSLSIPLTESVMPGDTLVAMLHLDNGDGMFSADKDIPAKGDSTMMMGGSDMMSFMAI